MIESINSSYASSIITDARKLECKRGWAGGEHTATGQGWEACDITSESPPHLQPGRPAAQRVTDLPETTL